VVLEFNVTLLYLKINYCDTRRVPSRYPLGNMGKNEGELYGEKKMTMGNYIFSNVWWDFTPGKGTLRVH